MEANEKPNTIPCPFCDGLGDVRYGTWDGDVEWELCDVCKGAKVIPNRYSWVQKPKGEK